MIAIMLSLGERLAEEGQDHEEAHERGRNDQSAQGAHHTLSQEPIGDQAGDDPTNRLELERAKGQIQRQEPSRADRKKTTDQHTQNQLTPTEDEGILGAQSDQARRSPG